MQARRSLAQVPSGQPQKYCQGWVLMHSYEAHNYMYRVGQVGASAHRILHLAMDINNRPILPMLGRYHPRTMVKIILRNTNGFA